MFLPAFLHQLLLDLKIGLPCLAESTTWGPVAPILGHARGEGHWAQPLLGQLEDPHAGPCEGAGNAHLPLL